MSEQNDLLTDIIVQTATEARDAGRLQEAEALFRQASIYAPQDPELHHHLGGIYARLGRLEDAERSYRRTVALAPGAMGSWRLLATLLLSQGKYEEGFALFESRHEVETMTKPALPFPEWQGGPVEGKRILIWPEQGFGDQIQFARFAPVLKARGAEVVLLCRPALTRLFAGCLGVTVLSAEGAVEFPDPDGWIMTMSLAWRLGFTPETIPAAPYLHALDPTPPLSAGFKVGLMARGEPSYANDANRSLPDEAARALESVAATVVILDPAVSGAKDFADTAAIIAGLDLVVSVDTAVAHLAGAMGKPCWIMLPSQEPDWRWLRDRADSPWYPSVRLYRQAADEDWNEVVKRVVADVAQAASKAA